MSWIEEKTQDLLMIGVLFGAFGWLILAPRFIPAPYGEVAAQVGYFVIVLVGVFGTDLIIQFYVNKFAYLEVLIRPSNRVVGLFLNNHESKVIDAAKDRHSTTLFLAFPVKIGAEKVKQVVLNHTRSWEDRIGFRSGGYARYNGYSVPHPQSERIEVYQEASGNLSIDHGETIPVFSLKTASKDYLSHLPMPKDPQKTKQAATKDAAASNMGEVAEEAPESIDASVSLEDETASKDAEILKLQSLVNEWMRKAGEWHQKAIAYEDIIKQQGVETKGLLEGKTGIQELAYEFLLTVYVACGSIDKALAQLKGNRMEWFNKYAMYAALGLIFFGYIWFNPDAAKAIQAWISVSTNQLFVLILIALGVVGFYLRSRRH